MRPGFTIVELLIVLLVVSVLSYVAVPRIEVFRFRMDGAARGSMAALVSAQRLAVKRQHDVIVVLDTVNERLLIHQDRDNDRAVGSGEPVRPVPFDEDVVFGTGAAPALDGSGAAVTFTQAQGGLPVIRFLRNGSAAEEGWFHLTSTRSAGRTIHGEDGRAIRVDRPTGRVTWYAYDGSVWEERY